MKKLFVITLMLTVIVGMLTFGGAASAEVTSGKAGETVTWVYDSNTKVLTITGTGTIEGDQEGVTSVIHYEWDSFKKEVETVIINEGITATGYKTFCEFRALTKIVMPKSLTLIGDQAFEGCENLKTVDLSYIEYMGVLAFWGAGLESVTIPEGISFLELGTFANCKNLKEVVFCSKMKDTGVATFRGCISLKKIVLPETIEIIGDYAFEDCTSLEEIVFGAKVREIGRGVFRGCKKIKKFVVPSLVTILDENLFTDCTSLEEIVIGDNVTKIYISALSGCDSLKSITIAEGNSQYASYNGALYNKDYSALIVIPDSYVGEYVVHPDTKVLQDNCAKNVKGLTSIILPEGLEMIGKDAFRASGITRIEFPSTLKYLYHSALYSCANLEEIIFYGSAPSVMSQSIKYTIKAKVYYPKYKDGWDEFWGVYYTVIEAIGVVCSGDHDVKIIEGTPATCKKSGMTDRLVCEKCGYILAEQEVIPAGHKILEYVVYSSRTHNGTCVGCDYKEVGPHEYEESSNICVVCGYVAEIDDFDSNIQEQEKIEESEEEYNKELKGYIVYIALLASGLALSTGAVAIGLQYKKK